jgi:hypothetical protein
MREDIQRRALSFQRCLGVIIAALREIFDETAYSRFLQRAGLPPSSSSYAAFQQEHALAKARHTKCC